jgi:LacI family transcriptional regulator
MQKHFKSMSELVRKEMSGVKEIAKRANVSIATVDRVIHNRTGVSEKTKVKIQEIIKELDYQPNLLARSLASRKFSSFAVLIPAVSEETAFWSAPLNGILQAESEVRRYGIVLEKYFFDQNDKATFIEQANNIIESQPDGVLMAPMFIDESVTFTNELQRLKIPYVFINSDVPNQDSLCYIGPDLYHSGYLGAHLMNYVIKDRGKVLIVNISREIDFHHHLIRKEDGFRAYFTENHIARQIIKTDINQTDYTSIKKKLAEVINSNPDIAAIFVTNSRVLSVARYLEENGLEDILLMGFDFLEENVKYLQKNIIDFLICQKPQEQAYRGVFALYNKLVLEVDVEKVTFMPIDIITRENYKYYNN